MIGFLFSEGSRVDWSFKFEYDEKFISSKILKNLKTTGYVKFIYAINICSVRFGEEAL